jgi:hypothetical protein
MQTDSLKNELFQKDEIDEYLNALNRLQDSLPEESFNKHDEMARLKSRLAHIDAKNFDNRELKASTKISFLTIFSNFINNITYFLPAHALAMTLLLALCISVSMNTYFYMSNSSSKDTELPPMRGPLGPGIKPEESSEMSIVFRGNPDLKRIDTSRSISLKQDLTITLSPEDPVTLLNSLFAAANEADLNFYHEILPGKNHIYIFALESGNVKQASLKQLAGLDNDVSGTLLIEISPSN